MTDRERLKVVLEMLENEANEFAQTADDLADTLGTNDARWSMAIGANDAAWRLLDKAREIAGKE